MSIYNNLKDPRRIPHGIPIFAQNMFDAGVASEMNSPCCSDHKFHATGQWRKVLVRVIMSPSCHTNTVGNGLIRPRPLTPIICTHLSI